MRKELGKIEGVRGRFTATIARFGKKNNFRGAPSETVLLTDVKDDQGNMIADHVWFTIGKTLSCVLGNQGKTISFEARITSYEKGYKKKGLEILKPREKDYKLSNPTSIKIL